MPIQRTYECTDCGHSFRFVHHPVDEPPPSFCPACGVKFDGTPYEPPPAPRIANPRHASMDQTYRALEDSSVARADMAYEAGGGDRADYNLMHVTDLKDNVREGEIAAKVEPSMVQQVMQHQALAGRVGQAPAPVVMQEYGGMLKSGPAAGYNAVPMAQQITTRHWQTAQQLNRAGQLNKAGS